MEEPSQETAEFRDLEDDWIGLPIPTPMLSEVSIEHWQDDVLRLALAHAVLPSRRIGLA